jgi:hypothetical protein
MPATATSNRPVPQVTARATWQARVDELRVKEKAQGGQFQLHGRPIAQWPRVRAGRDDDLGTAQ